MSCENTNARLQIKYTTIAGQVPTIPSTNDHNDGTWNPTDIYIGEFFLNSQDDLLWVRTLDGILVVGGTGGSASFIGDFVSKANGGTYSGPVFAPTFSAINMIATTISATAIDATIFGSTGSTYYGDGSNLTGITTNWNGGTVSDPTQFDNTVDFNQDISVNNVYSGTLGYIDIHSDIIVDGGLSASYFIGDGSLITNLPIGPTANDYTTSAYLDGNIIRYDRTDLADAYSVDLTPILFTQSVASFDWNSSTNDATLFINDGSFFTINLGIFNNISTAIINASDVYATNFYGTFNGTFSNDIYTTSATLAGTTAIFDRTDGVTYSLDLSSIAGGGGTGSAGTLQQTLILGNTIGTQSINFNGGANISANGTNIELKADGDIGGDLYLNSLTVADDTASGIEQISFSDISGTTRTSNISLSPGQTYEAHTINDIVFGTQQSTSTQRQTAKTLELIVDQSTGIDTEYRRELGVIGTTNGSSVKVTDNNSLEETQIKTDKSTITLQAKDLSLNDITKVEIKYNDVKISGTGSSFPGAQYDIDYSANYTNRSLVDKEYVDTHSETLEQTLQTGNYIGTQSINFGGETNMYAQEDGLGTHTFIVNALGATTSPGPYLGIDSYIKLTNDVDGVRLNASQDDGTIHKQNTIYASVGSVGMVNYDFISGNVTQIDLSPDSMEITDAGNGFGLKYANDYSATFIDRSLVDKGYVDNAVSGGGGGATGLGGVLAIDNTTGTQSIYISSSASQIKGYNGINQHWYNSANSLGAYLATETGTGASGSYIRLYEGRGDTHIYNNRYYNTAGTAIDPSERALIQVRPSTVLLEGQYRDFATNTFNVNTQVSISGQSFLSESFDDVNNASAQINGFTDGTDSSTFVQLQAYRVGGLSMSQIRVEPGLVILRSDSSTGANKTTIQQSYTSIIVKGETNLGPVTFKGIEYDVDYSTNFVNRSLVDKAYVDSKVAGATGSQSLANVLLVGATASTSIDMNGNNISEINTIGYTDGTTIDLINTINMSLLALMYNT